MNDIPVLRTVDHCRSRTTRRKTYVVSGLGGLLVVAALVLFVVQSGMLNPKISEVVSTVEGTRPDELTLERMAEILPNSAATPSPAVEGVAAPSASAEGSEASLLQNDISDDGNVVTYVETQQPLPAPTVSSPVPPAQNSDPPTPETGDLSISGRILNQTGDPVPKIEITARPSGYRQAISDTSVGRDRSDDKGAYEIRELIAGEYRVQTASTEVYPTAVIVARAGLQSADIVLTEGHTVTVVGTVTNTTGTPLAGVEVVRNNVTQQTRTGDDGNYALSLVTQPNRGYSIKYKLPGYREEQILVLGTEFAESRQKRIDVTLALQGNATNVTGLVTSDYGENVAGARIQVASSTLNTRYHGVSDAQGDFLIPDVEVGPDYSLTVTADDLYERYWIKPVTITTDHPPIDIRLTSLGTGGVSGNVMDVVGNPLSNFSLLLRSSRASHKSWPVITDGVGYFVVDGVPEGELTFATRSSPNLQTRGAALQAGDELYLILVLDWGYESIAGSVVNDVGKPVAGATISLVWSHQQDGLHSTSSRRTIAASTGSFRFTQLGPGVHTLDVSAAGYHRTKQYYDVGREFGELSVQLKSK